MAAIESLKISTGLPVEESTGKKMKKLVARSNTVQQSFNPAKSRILRELEKQEAVKEWPDENVTKAVKQKSRRKRKFQQPLNVIRDEQSAKRLKKTENDLQDTPLGTNMIGYDFIGMGSNCLTNFVSTLRNAPIF
jgi:hypothetical protein